MSLLSIYNSSLSLVGGTLLATISDNVRNAKLCNIHYDEARRVALSEGEWTFATKDLELDIPLVSTPSEWGYAFQLPTDHIRLVKVKRAKYDVVTNDDGLAILTNANPVQIKYVWDQMNDILWSPFFTQAVIHKLASLICNAIAESRTLKQDLDDGYRSAINDARASDGRQQMTQRTKSDTFINVRGGAR